VEGTVEIHAILPTKCKKTRNIREFLCKKDVGDMVHLSSIYKLISESNAKDLYEREDNRHEEHVEHKNILHVVDTVSIQSVANSTILQLNWDHFEEHFGDSITRNTVGHQDLGRSSEMQPNIGLDVNMLRTLMETNLNDHLQSIPIFEGLPNSKLEILSRLCKYSIEKKGSVLFREGDTGEDVFLLLSGEVKVEAMASKRMVELFEEGVLEPLNGDETGISLTSLSTGSNEHAKNAELGCKRRGSSNVQCDYIPIVKEESDGKKTLLRRRKTLLRARHNCRREKAESASSSHQTTSTHSPMEERLSRLDIPDPNHFVELARFHAGDYFGEISTFIGLPRVATVTATTNVLMASLSQTSFRTLYHVISPHLEASVEQIVKEHMLHTLLQSKSPFLEVINAEHATKMAEVTSITKFQEGHKVFYEGDEADKFYFVYSGRLSVEKLKKGEGNHGEGNANGAKEKDSKRQQAYTRIASLYAGDYFGEMALIDESRRLATITSRTESVLMEITRDNFQECFKQTPQLIAELIVRMRGRNVDLSSILSYNKSRNAFVEYLEIGETRNILSCYEDIARFEEKADKASNDTRMEDVIIIVEKYFSKGGSQRVNLPEDLANRVKAQVTNANHDFDDSATAQVIDSKIFSPIKNHIYRIMEKELLPRFKQNESFDLLMKRLRAYDELDVKMLA